MGRHTIAILMAMDVKGKIQTVLGCIAPSDAGVTMVHEHLCINSTALMAKKEPAHYPEFRNKPITPDINWWINHNPYSSVDNASHYQEKEAVADELRFYKKNGGGTIVENTVIGIKRDINFLAKVAAETNVNVVAGTGYYIESSRPETLTLTLEQMVDVMTTDIQHGCDGTDIKAGIIGELGCSWPLTDSEKRVLQSAAHVESELGCPVTVHPGRNEKAPFEIMRIYQEAGGHVDRFVMSHMDRTIQDIPDLLEFAKLGCYIDYDLFGIETSHYQLWEQVDMPSDAQRIQRIKALLDEGYGDRVTLAQDIHTKHRLMKYGGHGYSHILLHIVPKMMERGISREQVDKMLIDNPQRWLTFK